MGLTSDRVQIRERTAATISTAAMPAASAQPMRHSDPARLLCVAERRR